MPGAACVIALAAARECPHLHAAATAAHAVCMYLSEIGVARFLQQRLRQGKPGCWLVDVEDICVEIYG